MGAVWFTSDLHIGHELVAKERMRGRVLPRYVGAEIDAHDHILAEHWDAVVRPDDQVWVLGDISAGGKAAETNALRWLTQRPGWKHLVAGNHDSCHPMHRDAHKRQPEFLIEAFETVQAFARRRIAGQSVLLSHFPYVGDHTAVSRFDQYRLRDMGKLLLHGHTHDEAKVAPTPDWTTQIHVGVDAWDLRPVHIDELADLITGKAVS